MLPPPINKSSAIPTPPLTTRAPLDIDVLAVVFVTLANPLAFSAVKDPGN